MSNPVLINIVVIQKAPTLNQVRDFIKQHNTSLTTNLNLSPIGKTSEEHRI